MDSVIVFFGNASHYQVEHAAQSFGLSNGTVIQGSKHFFFWPYSDEEQAKELTDNEKIKLEQFFGRKPKCAFQVSSSHGESSRLALEVVSHLMSTFSPSLLDDDNGNIWSAQDIFTCMDSNPAAGIFSIRMKK